MKHLSILVLVLSACALVACGDEDTPTPKYHSPAPFYQPADDDTSPVAQLRRDFFARTGSYLLFNDTIQRQFVGTDINGDPVNFSETIDLGYYIGYTYNSTDTYSYTYLTAYEQQKQMVDYLDEYVLWHFKGRLKPFLYFLCNEIKVTYRTGNTSTLYAAAGQRGVAVAGNYLLQRQRTDSQKQQYAQRVIGTMIGQLANNFGEDFAPFYAISSAWYGLTWSQFGTEQTSALGSIGFIGPGSLSIYAPDAEEDLKQFAVACITYSDAEIASRYGRYPLVMQKFQLVKQILGSLGFVFEKNA